MPYIEEDFYRCAKCENPYFETKEEMVLKLDPNFTYDSSYSTQEAIVKQRKVKYICAKCGEVLDRAAAAKKIREERVEKKPVKKQLPDEEK